MDDCSRNEGSGTAPWLCHVCGLSSAEGVGRACALCFKVACPDHLRPVPMRNEALGHLELKPVCTACVPEEERAG